MPAVYRNAPASGLLPFPLSAIVFSAVVVACFFVRSVEAAEVEGEPDEAFKQEILEAMHRRAEFGKSFVFEWKETSSPIDEEVMKDLLDNIENAAGPEFKALAINRARTVVSIHQGSEYCLVVDGERMRFEEKGRGADISDPTKLVPKWMLAAFDGEICRRVHDGAGSYPLGSVTEANMTRGFEFVGSQPIVIALDGPNWIKPYKATATRTTLDGRPMAALRLEQIGNLPRIYTLWCDPQTDYQAHRVEIQSRGSLRSRYEISYKRDERSRQWVPVRWTITSFGRDGTIGQTKTSEVTRYEIGAEIPADEFQVEFSVGTYVRDSVRDEVYIVLEGDVVRMVTEAEQRAGLTYDELMAPLQIQPGDGEGKTEPQK